MKDWYAMRVIEEKITGTQNYFRFTVGNDIIEIAVSYPTGCYFEDINIEILDHYIRNRNNKPSNPKRTISLYGRIYSHLRRRYLEELKKAFNYIVAQPVNGRIFKEFSCMGETFHVGGTPKEVFSWFFRHYSSTCAAGDFSELVMQVPVTDGFLSEEIEWYLNV